MDEKQKSVLLTEQGYEDAEDVLEVWVVIGLCVCIAYLLRQGEQYCECSIGVSVQRSAQKRLMSVLSELSYQ